MSRMFSNARYVSILAALVVEGASEASGAHAITAFSADYQSAEPRTRRESLETREQLTQARARVFDTPHGGVRASALSVIHLRNLCQNLSDLSTIVHKCKQTFIS